MNTMLGVKCIIRYFKYKFNLVNTECSMLNPSKFHFREGLCCFILKNFRTSEHFHS